jgi:hypothetical protein
MAIMIPEDLPGWEPGGRAEGEIFEALRTGLPDEFFVYHHLRYVDPDRAREGEADFLVVHREHGILAIECKGAGVKLSGTGQWSRIVDGREIPLKESPFVQAQRTIKDLVRELKPRVAKEFPQLEGEFPFAHGHAVAFPSVLLGDLPLPLDVPKVIVLDAGDLAGIETRILEIYAFWKRASREPTRLLGPGEFKHLRRHVLHPKLDLVATLGAQIRQNEAAFIRMSQEQAVVLEGILANPQLRVIGGAGTGKTLLAVEAARRFAAEGRRTLLVCFNRPLAGRLGALVSDWDPPVEVSTFHGLCMKASRLLGEETWVPPKEDAEGSVRFWDEEAPFGLCRAVDAGLIPRWDAIVVDEGQDFAGEWWTVLRDCLVDPATSAMIVFYDPAQCIFGRECSVPEMPAKFTLRYNFRNTRRIAEYLARIVETDLRPHPSCPVGDEPVVREQSGRERALRELDELVERMIRIEGVLPDQLVILTPHTREHSLLARRTTVGSYPLADDPLDRAGAILHTSVGKFKGLESDVVILADVDPADPLCNANARYVAASRAKSGLYMFGNT